MKHPVVKRHIISVLALLSFYSRRRFLGKRPIGMFTGNVCNPITVRTTCLSREVGDIRVGRDIGA